MTTTTTPRPAVDRTSAPERTLTSTLPIRLVLAIAALWAVSLYVVFSLAPAPTGDPSTTAILIGLAFELSILATLTGFVMRQRWGLLASATGGGVLLVGAALCSLGGHTGGWLVAQYVTGAVILGVSQATFRRF
ncbi:MAG: hypothetical protein HKO70_09050 [Acidimicrobiia bacterium]|nr:hypothetical protein [Acidimicrobiia bacterium]